MAKPKKKNKPRRPPGRKADSAEVARRVEEVLRIRIDGAQFHDVVQFCAEKGWGLAERQLRVYLRRADDLLVERRDKNRRRLLARRLAQRDALYARCVNAADYRTALSVLADADRLRGLYPAEKHKHRHEAEARVRLEIVEEVVDAPADGPPPDGPAAPGPG